MKKIVFRVDSGNHMGIGHVMRCLTLALELKKRGHSISFITKNHLGFSKAQLESNFPTYVILNGLQNPLSEKEKAIYSNWLGGDVQTDLAETNKIISDELGEVDLAIVDHYALDEKFESGLKAKKVMVIDDLMDRSHFCDLVLDQNITADSKVYQNFMNKNKTVLLMGPAFALLREEFAVKHAESVNVKKDTDIKNILVFFGAADVNSDSLKLAKYLSQDIISKFNFTFILDSKHSTFTELDKILSKYPNAQLHSYVQNMSDLMIKTDLFIGAGGTTSWERASLGVASAVVSVADNQVKICRKLNEEGIIHYLGKSEDMSLEHWNNFLTSKVLDKKLWSQLRNNSFELVDGNGVARVINEIEKILND